MSALLPLFPLQLVLAPMELLPLHIFEPRYRDMIGRAIDTGDPFGLVLVAESGLATVGTLAVVVEVTKRYPDGRFDVLVQGRKRFRLIQPDNSKAYLQATWEPFLDDLDAEPPTESLRRGAVDSYLRLLRLTGRAQVVPDEGPFIRQYASFVMLPLSGLTTGDKQRVLERRSEAERLAALTEHFDERIPLLEAAESRQRLIWGNGRL